MGANTQWTNSSWWPSSPDCHWQWWKPYIWPQDNWIMSLPSHSSVTGTLIFKWNAKFTFISKEDFGLLGNGSLLFLNWLWSTIFSYFWYFSCPCTLFFTTAFPSTKLPCTLKQQSVKCQLHKQWPSVFSDNGQVKRLPQNCVIHILKFIAILFYWSKNWTLKFNLQ